MIAVTCVDEELRMDGHADDVRVCAAVSAVTTTLYSGYPVQRPVPGRFSMDLSLIRDTGVVDFVLNMLRLLARTYPQDLSFQE